MLLATFLAVVAAACPPNLANELRTQPSGSQLLTVEAPTMRTTHATFVAWRRGGDGCWRKAAGPYPARVGWNGLSADRREGDGTTPTGTFRIHPTMYGNEPNPGVAFRYRRLRCGDWWDEDPTSPTYNSFQHLRCGQRPPFAVKTEAMWETKRAYPFLAVVEFNMHPVVPGRGSGIFLHAQTGRPTNGCISLRRDHLRRVLRWLRPAAAPQIAIGTAAGLSS